MSEVTTADWIQLGIAVATAGGVGYAILQGQQAIKSDRQKNVIELLDKLEEQLTKIKEKEIELDKDTDKIEEKKPECYRYASDYLNVLDRMAFLGIVEYIDKKTLNFFKGEFAYGLKLIEWKKQMGYIKNDAPYPNIQNHVKQNQIKPDDDDSGLPKLLTLLSEKCHKRTS